MKSVRNAVLTCFFMAFFSPGSFSQNITGIWRGYFVTDGGEQYKYELQVDQSKKGGVSGVSYSYLDTRFYGKATLTGNYTRKSGTALVQEIRTVELKMSVGSVACIMKCNLVYSRSGREEFLEGEYNSIYEKNDPSQLVRRGGDCGGGHVFLRKVITSDFYIEPFLRNKIKQPKEEPKRDIVKKTPPPQKIIKPIIHPPNTHKSQQNTVIKHEPVKRPQVDTIATKKEPIVVVEKPVEKKIPTTPVVTRDRKNELTKTLVVNNEDIEIRLYDNGEIDGDTVSIYLDGKLILANKGLSEKPIIYHIKLNDEVPEHTLVMVAENMGRIPPNTSLMIVQDGDKRYQVGIVSTEQKNAMVRLRYEKE